MTSGGAAGHGFDFLTDPVLVITPEGRVTETNAAARAFFGTALDDGRIGALLADAPEDCARYLRLAGGSTSPRPGKFVFAGVAGAASLRTQAARSRRTIEQPCVILRLLPESSDRFAMLDRRVNHLDAQLRRRLEENAALQEALRQNRTFLRELQHRVKNNIQLMMSLIKMSGRGHDTPGVTDLVETSHRRLHAMAAAQEALYQSRDIDTVQARDFLVDVVRTVARANGAADALALSIEDADLSSEEAHCLALIANELVTNAVKYGLRDGQGRIEVTFLRDGTDYRLEVSDDGPGLPAEAVTRSSGLGLVRGLCRQIGGRLEIGGDRGTLCTVVFEADRRVEEDA